VVPDTGEYSRVATIAASSIEDVRRRNAPGNSHDAESERLGLIRLLTGVRLEVQLVKETIPVASQTWIVRGIGGCAFGPHVVSVTRYEHAPAPGWRGETRPA
jgi:hypothetical protein